MINPSLTEIAVLHAIRVAQQPLNRNGIHDDVIGGRDVIGAAIDNLLRRGEITASQGMGQYRRYDITSAGLKSLEGKKVPDLYAPAREREGEADKERTVKDAPAAVLRLGKYQDTWVRLYTSAGHSVYRIGADYRVSVPDVRAVLKHAGIKLGADREGNRGQSLEDLCHAIVSALKHARRAMPIADIRKRVQGSSLDIGRSMGHLERDNLIEITGATSAKFVLRLTKLGKEQVDTSRVESGNGS